MSYQIVKVTKRAANGKAVEAECDDGNVRYKCQYCGKWLLKEECIEHESGDYCSALREQGLDDAALAAIRTEKTVEELPVDEFGPFIKTIQLDRICKNKGIPISAMVKAWGGDRGLRPAMHPNFEYVYFGKARYVSAWTATPEGLDFIRSVAKRTAETKDGESTAKALKAPKSVKPQNPLEEALTSTVAQPEKTPKKATVKA